jgi:Tfp pilus assembly protein PilP
MTLRIGILLLGVMVTGAVAQNPDVIDNTRNTLQAIQKKETIDQNAALATAGQSQQPAASQPATAEQPPASQMSGPAAGASRSAAKPAPHRTKVAVSAAAKSAHPKPPAKPVVAAKPAAVPQPAVAVEDKKNPEESKKPESKAYSAAGRRDPFVSPVVTHISGPTGCNTGKRCLEIGQIMLTGIVKSENGMIAVVVNTLNKAYFLRENDPVFNGYVVKITGDSVIFSETGQDQLGKPFTREITKKIATPAA